MAQAAASGVFAKSVRMRKLNPSGCVNSKKQEASTMSEKSERDQKMFQSYLDNIKAKTGKTPDDFRALAAEKGLVKNGEIGHGSPLT
jgi:hypothetical protein